MFTTISPPDLNEFAGEPAVVTGGSRGLGATTETPTRATFIPGDVSSLKRLTCTTRV
jgi:hypothetical protein